MTDLRAAKKAFGDGDEEGALDALLAAWRTTRANEVAALAEAVSARMAPLLPPLRGKLEDFQADWLAVAKRQRPVDLPRLLASILHATQRSGVAVVKALIGRGAALAEWPADPRMTNAVVAHFDAGVFGATSKGCQPFWTSVFDLLLGHDDARAAAVLEKVDFDRIWKGWNDVAGRIAFMRAGLDRVVAELRSRHPDGSPPLPEALREDASILARNIERAGPVSDALRGRLGTPTISARSSTRTGRPTCTPRTAPDMSVALGALKKAAQALGVDDESSALEALLDAWRGTRARRIGALVNAVSKRIEPQLAPIDAPNRAAIQEAWIGVAKARRPADVPRLLGTITHTFHRSTDALTRVEALREWPPDPRIADGVIMTLENPPFHTGSTKPFWSALIELGVAHADAQTADAFEALAPRFEKIFRSPYRDLSSMRAWFAKNVIAAAASVRSQLEEPVLPGELEKACDDIADRLARDPREHFLAVIAANPEDDATKQVYADHLQQVGDPRGEFIALQISGRDPERAEALLRQHIEAWLGPIAPLVWAPGCAFERGFLVDVWLTDGANVDAIERALGHPSWATVRRIRLAPDEPLPSALLRHPVMRSLEHVGIVEAEQLTELLRWDRVPYASLALDLRLSAAERNALVGAAKKLKNLRAVELDGGWFKHPDDAEWLFESSLEERIETFALVDRCTSLGDWLARLGRTRVERFRFFHGMRAGGYLDIRRDGKGDFSVAKACLGFATATARKHAGEEMSYTSLAELLSTVEPRTLTKLVIMGRAGSPADLKRVGQLRKRFTEATIETS